jgi:hypothetical protein
MFKMVLKMNKFKKNKILKPKDNHEIYKKALVGSYFSSDLRHYAEGYYRAANILINELKGDRKNPANILVYPICFLYRHYIEIALKGIIDQHIKLGHMEESKYGHDIMYLFKIVTKLRKDYDITNFPKKITQIIEDFYEIDRTSQSFRYPFDRNKRFFFNEHGVFDLETLKENMVKVEGGISK